MMTLEFIGADREVTGSCHCVTCDDTVFLVDYGMEQGINIFENAPLSTPPENISFVLLTHAHIDHSGLLPVLYKNGFRGKIYATDATCDLCRIMLLDSANIQESDAAYKNKKALRAGEEPVEPLYTTEEAEKTLELFVPVSYNEMLEISDSISVRFTDAGHIFGSASIEVWLRPESGTNRKIVFSGDIGNTGKPIIRDPQYISGADYVLTESTYANENRKNGSDHVQELAGIIQRTLDRGGNVLIPSFAVGRTQELLYMLRRIKSEQLVKGHDGFKVWVDSPLAIEATRVYKENLQDCYDEETREIVKAGINPIEFDDLRCAVTSEESIAINSMTDPKVIIASSGMCDAGRIRHHLKHHLWKPETTVVFAGYQAQGTIGRMLQDKAPKIKLFGDTIAANAEIVTMQAISSHADRNGLLKWISAFQENTPLHIFVVHGEDRKALDYAEYLSGYMNTNAAAPASGSLFDLENNDWIIQTQPVYLDKKVLNEKKNKGIYVKINPENISKTGR